MRKRYSIWDEMQRIHEQMDSLFESFLSGKDFFDGFNNGTSMLTGPSASLPAKSNYRQPVTDLQETDKEFISTLELPGIDKKDIEINATEDGVEIKVEKKQEDENKDEAKGVYSYASQYTGFYKYLPLPEGIDANKIKASYKNGVLELRMPKLVDSKKKTKRISVD